MAFWVGVQMSFDSWWDQEIIFFYTCLLVKKAKQTLAGPSKFWFAMNRLKRWRPLALSVASFSLHTKNWKIEYHLKICLVCLSQQTTSSFYPDSNCLRLMVAKVLLSKPLWIGFPYIYPLSLASTKTRSSLRVHVLTSPNEKKMAIGILPFRSLKSFCKCRLCFFWLWVRKATFNFLCWFFFELWRGSYHIQFFKESILP